MNNRKIHLNVYLILIFKLIIALLLFGLCRAIFYWYNLSYFPNIATNDLAYMFFGGLRFDIVALSYLLSLYIFLLLIPFHLVRTEKYQRITNYFYSVPLSIGVITNLADSVYYQITLKRTTFSIFQQFSNETNMSKLIGMFLIDYWYMTLLAAVLIYFVFKLNYLFTIKPEQSNNTKFYLKSSSILIVATLLIIIGIRGGYKHSTRPITLSNASKYIQKPEQRAIVLNTPFSIIRSSGKKTLKNIQYFNSQDEQQNIYTAIHKGKPDTIFNKKNIVIFILESFGREHIGAFNKHIPNYKGFTPFFDSLITHSFAYKNAFANGRKSISGMPSVLASIPSLVDPFVLSHYSGNKINSLASLLKDQGYYSAFFHGAPNGSMGFDAFTKQAGFDAYFGKDEYNNDDHFDGTWGIWDEEFFQYYANEMNNMKEPFITSLFSVSSHHPFKLPKRYDGVFPEGKLEIQRTIAYTDFALKQFFNTVKKMHWYDNTIFVFTADHASTFSNLPEYKSPTGYFAVPIVIFEPSANEPKHIDSITVAQQIDIMPTLLSMINYPNDFVAFGSNIYDKSINHFAISYNAENYHFIKDSILIQFDGNKISGMYNFINDPYFSNNQLKNHDDSIQIDDQLVKAFIQEYNRRMIDDELTIK